MARKKAKKATKAAKKKSVVRRIKTLKKPIKKMKKRVKKSAKRTKAKREKKVSAIPKGYHSMTPCIIVKHAAKAIDFYQSVFGAKQVMRMESPNGKITHAELKIGDAKLMLADECPEMEAFAPESGKGAVSIYLYVKNVDAVVEKAVKAGSTLRQPVENMFYGDRIGMLEDPFGHKWCVATHIEDVSKAKIRKRAKELFSKNEKFN